MTYFAITVGSKDASCIAGADRKIGDVHGGPRDKGVWEGGVGRRAGVEGILVRRVNLSFSLSLSVWVRVCVCVWLRGRGKTDQCTRRWWVGSVEEGFPQQVQGAVA